MSFHVSSSKSMPSNMCWRHLSYATVLLLLAAASWTSEAFIIVVPAKTTKKNMMRSSSSVRPTIATKITSSPLFATPNNTNDYDKSNNQSTTTTKKKLTHAEITWKLRPPENTSKFARLKTKFGANALRLYSKLKGETLPPVLCPKGGRAMLEAYYREPGLLKRRQMIGRFGFTTSRGPSNTEIDTTIRQVYNINPPPLSATIAAIIYMYVEPPYRHRDVGSLALTVISAIQSVQAVDFTVLVAAGDERLVEWYEKNGYVRAPLLQEVMGSAGGEFGVTMIAPVGVREGFFEECDLKWW
mmetsp:Transcript_23345/g.34853  ORF Transcript_23345/g.34853 Transcript_23345/m.34853 type:complete len:299 (-) Transcript_23345:245-1141(-)